ncbi:unnamed protein product [Schistosoma curassoni]|uniref:Wsv008 n=1 Tax=Schistosoma curassoni TaxID=6186 RepID=A0A183KNN5_9TREM|nr:unnamed protein product [Schistosoma curassoni]
MRHLSNPVVLIDFYNLSLNVVTGLDSLSSHTLCLNSRDDPKIDSSQYQITELPGPFSSGLLFTTPRLTKDNQFDSTSSSVSSSPSVTVSASCHLFKQKDSLSYKRSNGLLKMLSSPYYIIRNMISRNSSNIRSTSVHPIYDSSNWTTLPKQDHIHSNQVIATGTLPNSLLHNNNVSDKRRSILLHTMSSTTSLSAQSTTNSTSSSSPRNQSKQQLSSHHNSKRSHSHWFRFTDTQLACLLLILFSLATLLVAMSLQYVLNVHLKLSNPTTTSSSSSSDSFSSMDLSPSSSESYGMKLKLNHDKMHNDGSSVFTTTTTTSKRTNQNVHS